LKAGGSCEHHLSGGLAGKAGRLRAAGVVGAGPGGTRLGALTPDHVIYAEASASEKDVAEMFDKYNLLTLPVVDEEQRLTGIITADDVISLLRDRI